jgi:hypothetical protein
MARLPRAGWQESVLWVRGDTQAGDPTPREFCRLPAAPLRCDDLTPAVVGWQLKKYFTFEVQVLDDKNVRRRFRASNYQSTTRVKPFICTMPMRLDEGWNQIQFNLSDFTRRAYGTNYIETLRVQIHANCRIRRCAIIPCFLAVGVVSRV